jgi:hypothetical protein
VSKAQSSEVNSAGADLSQYKNEKVIEKIREPKKLKLKKDVREIMAQNVQIKYTKKGSNQIRTDNVKDTYLATTNKRTVAQTGIQSESSKRSLSKASSSKSVRSFDPNKTGD